ncbi:MAG: DUF1592 domain-containing protein [Pirellulales bacterium]|nr:DUF1592 domain-containing protein [Pirellulales bacterium]
MNRFSSSVCLIVLWLCSSSHAATSEVHFPQEHQAFFKKHCLDCHDSATQEGGVDLETLSFTIATIEQAERWQKVLNVLNSGEMPPEDSEQPDGSGKADFLDELAQTMVSARRSLADSGGRITMRRLNRREYQNTIEQLLGLKVDVSSLPADGGSGTFDTVGSSQFISSDQIEQYLKLGRNALDEAFERQATRQQPAKTFRVEPENTVNVLSRKKIAEQEEMYQRYLLWKAEVDKAALLPENEKLLAQLREKYNLDDLTNSIRLYQNTGLLKGAPDATKFGFRDGNKASFSYQGGYDRTQAYMKQYLEFPNSNRGTYLKLAWGIQRIDVVPDPKDVPPGKYKLRIRAGVIEGSDPSRHFIEIGHPQRVNGVLAGFSGKPLAGLQVLGTEDNPEIIETTLVIGSNTPREFGIQERRPESSKKMLSREFYSYKRENGYGTPPAIWVDWIELEGPVTESAVTKSAITRVEPENTINGKNREIITRLEDTYNEKWLPWKKGVDKAAESPENEDIVAALRKQHPDYDSDPVLKYKKAGLLKGAPDPRDYGGSDPINAVAALYSPYRRYHSYMKHYAELPHNDRGAYLQLSRGIQRFDIHPDPKDVPSGNYKLRVRLGAVEGSDSSRHFVEIGHPQKLNGTSPGFAKLLSTQPISGTIENPEIIEVNIEFGESTPRVVGIQERQPKSEKLVREDFDRHKQKNGYGTPPAIWVDWMELEGPITEAAATESKIVRVEPEKTINPANEKEIMQIEDAYTRFTRWQKGVDKVAVTPENRARMAKFRKTEPKSAHPIWSYGFADRLEGTPDPKDFGFRDSQKAAASHPENDRANLAYHKHYAALPHRDRGTYLKVAHGTGRIIVSPKKLPAGNYVMRVRVGAVEGTPPARRFIQVGHPQRLIESRNWGLEGPAISTHQVTGTIDNPETIEIPLEVTSDTIREFAVQEKQPNNGNLKALWDAHNKLKAQNGYGHPPAIWIDWVELEGPLSSSRKQWKQRREVELHANAKVGGTYNGYFKGGYEKGKAFLDTGTPQKGIVDEWEANFRIRQFEEKGPAYLCYLDDPLTQAGSFLTISEVNKEEYIALPPEHPSGWKKTDHIVESLPPGTYKLRCRIGAVEGASAERHFVDLGTVPDKEHFDRLATFQITGSTDEPEIIELLVQLTKDSPRKFALREKRDVKADVDRDREARKENGVGIKPALWIDWVEWEGPLDASNESGRKNWLITEADEPEESLRAQKMIKQFALEAFRGVEPEAEYIDRLTGLFVIRREAGDSFDTAIRLPLSIVLASPGFLYLSEPNNADDRRQLTDRELAVRLAYFLWSAPPDHELLELAQQQQLSQPEMLRQQVDRMIADERSDEFVSGFVHQWLDMERLDFFQFDTRLYRDFDESTRAAAREEVYQSFAHLLRGGEDGRISQLLKSETVFINGLLANYYGIEGVTGDEFQEVSLPEGSPRGGLLGMAAIHAMGSDGVVSSPVERGAWVLRHLLHDPPPPAPPNVPQISRLQGEILTTRERLRVHQEEAQCASCHRKIDPIGLGLENFNAAGKWRTTDSYQARDKRGRGVGKKKTWDVDPSGAIYNGPSFADYFELRDIVVSRQDDFARGFTEHLIEYALGRPFGFTDEDFAEEVVQAAKIKDYAVSEFVHAVVQSKAFHSK